MIPSVMDLTAMRQRVLPLARLGMIMAVLFMAGWNAYICLRLRPDVPTTIVNLSFWLVPVLALIAVSGRMWRSLALGTGIAFALQRLHWLKWKYLEQSWTAADLRFLADPANVILLRQYPETLAWAIAGASGLMLSWLLMPRGRDLTWVPRVTCAAVVMALATTVTAYRQHHPFDPFGFNNYGHFASLVYSWSTLFYEPPVVDGSSDLFLARAAAVPPAPQRVPAPPPTIVVWLQESSVDLRVFDLPAAHLPVLDMYDGDARTRAFGPLRVHSWGGSTWLSEFALLTGLSHFDFGPTGEGVYYTVASHVRYSLPMLLKTYGYRSIAISGVPKGLYNMETAQRHLGFDEVLNPLDFPEWGGKSLATHLISDEELGRYADQVIARAQGRPLFLFVLSMMQHGPYDSTHRVGYGLERAGLVPAHAARVSDFVDRMVATNVAARAYGEHLLGAAAPAVFAYFGDHHPNLDGALPFKAGLEEPRYLTAYAVKSNLPGRPVAAAPTMLDVSYLGSLILEEAGLSLGPLFSANRAMRVLCDGRLTDCRDDTLTASYRAHLYTDLRAASLH